jgi:hypothetical protein
MSTMATTAQTADSTTGFVGIYFTTATEPIPLKARAFAVCNIGSNTTAGTKSRGRSN